METKRLTITPLAGALGARVEGLDLREPLEDGALRAVSAALDEHLVLIFPDQHLDDAQQLAFARRFGEPYIHPLGRIAGATEARVEHIVDAHDSRPYQDRWHTDVTFDVDPPTVGTLRAIEIPERGGDTVWANMIAAWDALSPAMQGALEGLVGVHDSGAGEAFREKVGEELTRRLEAQFQGTPHPLVREHPRTGRRYLYANAQFTRSIQGMTPQESDALLGFLAEHVKNPNYHYRHRWTPGELGLWDERATQHFAVADHYPQRREMGRMVVREAASA